MSNKRALKRKRAKERKKELFQQSMKIKSIVEQEKNEAAEEIEYITEVPTFSKNYELYKDVFAKFTLPSTDDSEENSVNSAQKDGAQGRELVAAESSSQYPLETKDQSGRKHRLKEDSESSESDSDEKENAGDESRRISNKKRKLRDRLSIAQLKQLVDRPDLVELHDTNSTDPVLLVHLKATRNSVPVPDHWIEKRRYLQGKRGFEKPPFVLPKAIQDTGVSELRNAGKLTSLKQKQRQRMNPKLGRLDVDYQKLHAAFFRYMEKPKMTTHGDIYYMGKENEVKYRRHRPGVLSKRLKNALHMIDNAPPPYLINMQRFGPPPSYPELKIPGLNSPLPPGCKYGYSEGQWGKPPVNEHGYPLYGDPFGVNTSYAEDDNVDPSSYQWGRVEENVAYDEFEDEEMEEEGEQEDLSEEEEAEEEKNDEQSEKDEEKSAFAPGIETPEVVSIRKNIGVDTPETPIGFKSDKEGKQLYKVLDQKEASVKSKNAMGSAHTYNIAAEESKQRLQTSGAKKVSVALNEEELANLDEFTIKMKYDEEIRKAEKQGNDFKKQDLRLARETTKKKKSKKKKKDALAGFKF